MRTCYNCQGSGKIDVSEKEDNSEIEPCWTCGESGEIENGCFCAARSPYECGCGGWDDVNLEDWT